MGNSPDATDSARVIVVSGRVSDFRLSQDAAAKAGMAAVSKHAATGVNLCMGLL